jgi:hypothetical protein
MASRRFARRSDIRRGLRRIAHRNQGYPPEALAERRPDQVRSAANRSASTASGLANQHRSVVADAAGVVEQHPYRHGDPQVPDPGNAGGGKSPRRSSLRLRLIRLGSVSAASEPNVAPEPPGLMLSFHVSAGVAIAPDVAAEGLCFKPRATVADNVWFGFSPLPQPARSRTASSGDPGAVRSLSDLGSPSRTGCGC